MAQSSGIRVRCSVRVLHVLWCAVLCVPLVVPGLSSARVAVGDTVDPFSLERMGGGTARVPQDFQGKVILLNFWASWCPECKVEMPELAKIGEGFKGKPFVLVTVSIDRDKKAAEEFLKKMGWNLLVLYDTEQRAIRYFQPFGIPASYLISPGGTVAKEYLGFDKSYIKMYISDIEGQLKNLHQEVSVRD